MFFIENNNTLCYKYNITCDNKSAQIQKGDLLMKKSTKKIIIWILVLALITPVLVWSGALAKNLALTVMHKDKIENILKETTNLKDMKKYGDIDEIIDKIWDYHPEVFLNKTNLSYIEPHKIIINNNVFLAFNYSNEIYINNLSRKVKINELENYIKNQKYGHLVLKY